MPRYLGSLNDERSPSTDFAVELPDDATVVKMTLLAADVGLTVRSNPRLHAFGVTITVRDSAGNTVGLASASLQKSNVP
jgi:hypothetical protein